MTEARQTLAGLLSDARTEIVARFVAEIQRKGLPPEGASRLLLVDHIPQFLDEVVEELTQSDRVRDSQDSSDTSEAGRRHGKTRQQLGYDLTELIREYGVLRHVIMKVAAEHGVPITIDEFEIVAKCFNVGVAEAAEAHTAHYLEEVANQRAELEYVAHAGEVLGSTLDYRSALTKLTKLLVPRLADWCVVSATGSGGDVELTIAHTDPTKVPALSAIFRPAGPDGGPPAAFILRGSSPGPVFLEEINEARLRELARSDEELDALGFVGLKAAAVLPLVVQGEMIGSVTFASAGAARAYSDRDRLTAVEIVRRASVAIDNARLYAMSQRERARAEAVTRAKDELVAVISHELRTPLNAVIGWLGLLRTGGLPEEKRSHALEVMDRNTRAQARLLSDMLDVSRVISGTIRLNVSQVDLADILEMAIEGLRTAVDAKRLTVHPEIDEKNAMIRGDAERLQQIAWNLLSNAVKFSTKGGSIHITLRRVESEMELVVRDDGIGIRSEFLPHVFDTFHQHDRGTTRTYGGLGIGLSIARHLVELHGGSIEASSEGQNKGSKFVVRLPVSPVTTTAIRRRARAALPRVESRQAGLLRGVRVVVLDDEADARELLQTVLDVAGAEVRSVATAEEALAAIADWVPDVIVSDIGLKDASGYDFVRTLRTSGDKAVAEVPAIALTAYTASEERARALVEGFNIFFTKPVEPAELVASIAELIGRAVESSD